MTRTRCLFVLPTLGGGGAERVVTTLLRHLDRERFELHLAVGRSDGPSARRLPADVTLHDLDASRVARSIVPLVRTVRRLRPQVVFSTMLHMNLAVAASRWGWPRGVQLVLRETNLIDRTFRAWRAPSVWRSVGRRLYAQADAVVCQTEFMRAELQRVLRVPGERLQVIPNPVDLEAIDRAVAQSTSPYSGAGPHVVALGRLRPVKGIDRLLRAFCQLAERHSGARLWLLGDGPCESPLRRQAEMLGIADRVRFAGYQSEPYRWLSAADLMVVSSYAESCSNAILEAVACGCPTVALQHPGGTQEQLAELGLSDRFVPRLESWPDAWFQRLPAAAIQRVRDRHDAQRITNQYAQLLASLTARPQACALRPYRNALPFRSTGAWIDDRARSP